MEDKKQAKKLNEIRIEKVILNSGGTQDKLEKEVKLLEIISGRKVVKTESRRRIPSLGVRPGLEGGCRVTIRGKGTYELLKRLLGAVENQLKKKCFKENHFSFGIAEYIEIPGMEYQRDVGILGLDVTVVFCRAGKRVVYRRIKTGRLPKKQHVTENEIVEFMQKTFNTNIK